MAEVVGRFTFEEDIHGAGGFAKVIKGRDNVLERDIAIKVLDPLATDFPESDQERFRREARILARLSHPNVPAIYDVDFNSPGKFAIIFQFIEGLTLKEVLHEGGPCQLKEARTWFHQIASALDHAHELGIIHRDVKPDNIIIRPDRESAYLVDFGIALSKEDAEKLTESGFVIGTRGYMPPEQLAGEEVDGRADIYSLGVTLYEALAGKEMPVGQYEELASTNEAVPPQIDDLIQYCLQSKDRRLNSLKTFSSRLLGALRSLKPLSDVLAHGSLYELASILEELTSNDFINLPKGQQALILAKVSDIVSSDDAKLQFASERFLDLLLSRGMLLSKDEYREIVNPAIKWGFERSFSGALLGKKLGRDKLRRALEQAGAFAQNVAHEVLREEFGNFIREVDFGEKEDWYLHAVRQMLQTLLANPSCVKGYDDLVAALKKVNSIQRSRSANRELPLTVPN